MAGLITRVGERGREILKTRHAKCFDWIERGRTKVLSLAGTGAPFCRYSAALSPCHLVSSYATVGSPCQNLKRLTFVSPFQTRKAGLTEIEGGAKTKQHLKVSFFVSRFQENLKFNERFCGKGLGVDARACKLLIVKHLFCFCRQHGVLKRLKSKSMPICESPCVWADHAWIHVASRRLVG